MPLDPPLEKDTRFPTEVESGFGSIIETIPPNSQRLDTLQGFWGGVPIPGHASLEKKLEI